MKSLVFLKEDGKGNIYDENGAEAMDIVDEKPYSYLKESAKFPSNVKHIGQSEEEIGTTMKISADCLTKYMSYSSGTKKLFFQYKVQCLMSVRAAALKAGVKESTAPAWCRNHSYRKSISNV